MSGLAHPVPERLSGPAAAVRPSRETRLRPDAATAAEAEAATGVVPRWLTALTLAVSAAWIAVSAYVVWPAFRYRAIVSESIIDASFFGYAGDVVRHGGVPYLAFWDHKPPLIYLIHALALDASGGATWGLWLAGVLALVAAAGLAWLVLRKLYGPAPALLGVVFFAVAVPTLLAIDMTEGYAPPLQWLAVLALVRWTRGAAPLPAGIVVGLAGGALAFLRPNLIGAAVAVALVVSLLLLARRDVGGWLRFAGGAVLGALLVVGPILAWLAARGALGAFYDQVIHYNSLYAVADWKRRVRYAFTGADLAGSGAYVLALAMWLLAAWRLARERAARRDAALLLAVLWLPIEALFAATSGRSYGHYFMPVFAPLAYLVAGLGATLLRWARTAPAGTASGAGGPGVPGGAVLAALAAALLIPPAGTLLFQFRDHGFRHERSDQVEAAAAYLRQHTRVDDPVLVWGHASDVYLFSGRRPASRYVYPLPLLDPRYTSRAKVDGYLAELERARPPVIVDATHKVRKGDDIVPSLGSWNPRWKVPNDSVSKEVWWSMTPAMREVYDWVASHYALVDSVGPDRWPVYRRRAVAIAARAPLDTTTEAVGAGTP